MMVYLLKIFIFNLNQFTDFRLDLTYPSGPKKGKPLDKVCFIGKNGTGKSTLLSLIENILTNVDENRVAKYLMKISVDNVSYYATTRSGPTRRPILHLYREEIEDIPNFENFFKPDASYPDGNISGQGIEKYRVNFTGDNVIANLQILSHSLNQPDRLLITVPADSNMSLYKQIQDVPKSDVNTALNAMNTVAYKHIISPETVNDFWKNLIYLIKKRESDLIKFSSISVNLDKTVREVRDEFERNNPQILEEISRLWNNILEKGGLEFDITKASIPIQLSDNLRAYIKSKSRNTNISYSSLSTGIRNFIFTLGHIYTLYFNRRVRQGYLLIDEPENSLFPDLLYNLIGLYKSITKNTQLFVSTHSPIIAAQFEPSERILLDFAEDGSIVSSRGVTPIGDDPNDILLKDFHIKSLLGPEGIRKWERYIELRLLIQKAQNPDEKRKLLKEYMDIGNAYEFGATEIE